MRRPGLPFYWTPWSPRRWVRSKLRVEGKAVWCEEKKDYIVPLGVCEKCRWYADWDGTGTGRECKFDWQERQEYERLMAEEEGVGPLEIEPVDAEDVDEEEETDSATFYPYVDTHDEEAYEKLNSLNEQNREQDRDEQKDRK